MADEWVSVRARLAKDGKTISMTNHLSKLPEFQKWIGVDVTALHRNALLSVTIKALIEVWAVGNSRGELDGDDAVLTFTDFAAIDEIAEVPGFSKAMAHVHWLHEDDSDGVSAVRLPNFREYNIPSEVRSEAEERKRKSNRERQARFRERHNGNNALVTVNNTHTEQDITEQNRTTIEGSSLERGTGGNLSSAGANSKPPTEQEALGRFNGYSLAFLNAFNSYPAKKRAKKAEANDVWKKAVISLAERFGGVDYKAEDWLFTRVSQFSKSPLAQSEYCPGILRFLHEGRFDDADEAWLSEQDIQPESQYRKLKPIGAA